MRSSVRVCERPLREVGVHAQKDLVAALRLHRARASGLRRAGAQQADEQLLHIRRDELLRAQRGVRTALQRRSRRVVQRRCKGALRLGHDAADERALRFRPWDRAPRPRRARASPSQKKLATTRFGAELPVARSAWNSPGRVYEQAAPAQAQLSAPRQDVHLALVNIYELPEVVLLALEIVAAGILK